MYICTFIPGMYVLTYIHVYLPDYFIPVATYYLYQMNETIDVIYVYKSKKKICGAIICMCKQIACHYVCTYDLLSLTHI